MNVMDVRQAPQEVAFSLYLKGCKLADAVSDELEIYFQVEAGVSLREAITREATNVLCALLSTPSAYRNHYCSLEALYDEVTTHGTAGPNIYALRFTHEPQVVRAYYLYYVYLRHVEETKVALRLLKFPSVMRLQVTDIGPYVHDDAIGPLAQLPSGLIIDVPPFLREQRITLNDINPTLLPEMRDAARFYTYILDGLGQKAPEQLWSEANNKFSVAADIPAAIDEVCNQPRLDLTEQARRDHIAATLRHQWINALDAPILSQLVFPQIQRQLAQDDDFRFAPRAPLTDRDRYFRLHLPLEELEAQEHYVGWLPAQRAYRDERSAVRDALHAR
jgi:hypothetical protein